MYIDIDSLNKGRNLDKFFQPLLLSIVARSGGVHGFAIMKELSAISSFEGNMPDAAGIYRYLKKLENSGFLTSEWDISEPDDSSGKPKRIFRITDDGLKCLHSWSSVLSDYDQYIRLLMKRINEAETI